MVRARGDRFNRNSYDSGVGSNQAADGAYQVGDLDTQGDAVNCWTGYVLTIFVR